MQICTKQSCTKCGLYLLYFLLCVTPADLNILFPVCFTVCFCFFLLCECLWFVCTMQSVLFDEVCVASFQAGGADGVESCVSLPGWRCLIFAWQLVPFTHAASQGLVCAHLFYVLNISDYIIRVYKESDSIQTDAVNTNVKAVLCSEWLFLIERNTVDE